MDAALSVSACAVFEGHRGPVLCAVALPEQQCLLSAGHDQLIRCWPAHDKRSLSPSLSPATVRRPLFAIHAHDHLVSALDVCRSPALSLSPSTAPSPSLLPAIGTGTAPAAKETEALLVVSASWDKTVKVWDWRTQRLVHTLRGHRNRVRALRTLSRAGDTHAVRCVAVSGDDDGAVLVWDLLRGSLSKRLQAHTHFVLSLALLEPQLCVTDSEGEPQCALRCLSLGDDGALRVWDLSQTSHTSHTADSDTHSQTDCDSHTLSPAHTVLRDSLQNAVSLTVQRVRHSVVSQLASASRLSQTTDRERETENERNVAVITNTHGDLLLLDANTGTQLWASPSFTEGETENDRKAQFDDIAETKREKVVGAFILDAQTCAASPSISAAETPSSSILPSLTASGSLSLYALCVTENGVLRVRDLLSTQSVPLTFALSVDSSPLRALGVVWERFETPTEVHARALPPKGRDKRRERLRLTVFDGEGLITSHTLSFPHMLACAHTHPMSQPRALSVSLPPSRRSSPSVLSKERALSEDSTVSTVLRVHAHSSANTIKETLATTETLTSVSTDTEITTEHQPRRDSGSANGFWAHLDDRQYSFTRLRLQSLRTRKSDTLAFDVKASVKNTPTMSLDPLRPAGQLVVGGMEPVSMSGPRQRTRRSGKPRLQPLR